MDFEKLKADMDAALSPPVVMEKAMTQADFETYAKEQVALAKAENDAGTTDEAKARIEHLKAQAEAVAKFEYKPGELPTVKFFKAKEQTRPAPATTPAMQHQALGGPGQGYTAKAMAEKLGTMIAEFLGEAPATGAPPAAITPPVPPPVAAVWPRDLAVDDK